MRQLVSHALAFAAGLMVAWAVVDRPSFPAGGTPNVHRAYHPSGALWRECPLDRSGRLHGAMTEYDEEGNVTGVMEMSHGQFVRARSYR